MYSLGYDIGSSSIKCSVINIESGSIIAQDFYPEEEMKIISPKPGWAEQDPNMWWEYVKIVTKKVFSENSINPKLIASIGISYQMHGLVLVDKDYKVLRPSIIWCDSRAVEIGNKAYDSIGGDICLSTLLNSPGNFTASKLRWVKENEKNVYDKIHKIMLPGDFIAMKLTGEISSTISGLSEGIFWNFKTNSVSKEILAEYEIDESILPDTHPTFSVQGSVNKTAADELGINEGTIVSYRAGDQPNNAFSLNVLKPGEVAATAGTSGVVYGVIGEINYDKFSRVNQFAHVNHSDKNINLGVLLCINGTGIQNSWVRKNFAADLTYDQLNNYASEIPIGSDGVIIMPFGNGAERVLMNKNIGSQITGIDFNRHNRSHILRAAQEGIAFSFKYGVDIMKEMGLKISVIRAGKANMFLSNIFRETLADITGASIELYNTDGSQGAARGAAYGAGFYKSFEEAFNSLKKVGEVNPDNIRSEQAVEVYKKWLNELNKIIR